jgi:hypothetical protein
LEKPPLQNKFTLLQSKFFRFPAKISFSKIQKKNLAGKKLQKSEFYFAKERGPIYFKLNFSFYKK